MGDWLANIAGVLSVLTGGLVVRKGVPFSSLVGCFLGLDVVDQFALLAVAGDVGVDLVHHSALDALACHLVDVSFLAVVELVRRDCSLFALALLVGDSLDALDLLLASDLRGDSLEGLGLDDLGPLQVRLLRSPVELRLVVLDDINQVLPFVLQLHHSLPEELHLLPNFLGALRNTSSSVLLEFKDHSVVSLL